MFTSVFWRAAGERAAKTFAQTLLAALTLSSATIDVLHVNWVGALSVALGATLYSLLTSAAGLIPAFSPSPAVVAAAVQPAVVPPTADAVQHPTAAELAENAAERSPDPDPPALGADVDPSAHGSLMGEAAGPLPIEAEAQAAAAAQTTPA